MKLYHTENGPLLSHEGGYCLPGERDWDRLVNDEHLFETLQEAAATADPLSAEKAEQLITGNLRPPIGSQEVWASGVTYYNSKLGRQEESKDAGGGDFYARVYDADRPELFFKATAARTVGPGEEVRIREDSDWDVPEPELTLMITSGGSIVGYTIGNDMSSRSIEGENPLYLPQAKSYDGSAALGPCLYVTRDPLPSETEISMEVEREGEVIFADRIAISQIKRTLEELVAYLYRECSFPHGCLLMTGTGIVPSGDFTLHHGDEIRISVPPIGTLTNRVS